MFGIPTTRSTRTIRPQRTQVGRDVGESQIESSAHDDFGRIAVFARAHEGRVVNRAFHNFVRRRPRTNDPHVILDRRLAQRQILTDQDPDPDPTNVKPIKELVDLLLRFKFNVAPFPYGFAEFKRSSRHLDNDVGVTVVHPFEGTGHFIFLCNSRNFVG